ncbi:MAG TPA: hypothetical protein VFU47_15980 [Armatimonadota bacterium]|nr:hypothetical protein [Armatimonadota bacterium]
MIQVRVQFDLNRTNPNRRHCLNPMRDQRARRAEKNALIEAARWAWKQAGRPQAEGPVRYRVRVRRSARLEDDNAIAGLKAARDALFCGKRFADDGGAITLNDNANWLTFDGLIWETARKYRFREEVVFEVIGKEERWDD